MMSITEDTDIVQVACYKPNKTELTVDCMYSMLACQINLNWLKFMALMNKAVERENDRIDILKRGKRKIL